MDETDLTPLSEEEINRQLGGLTGWTYGDNKIQKTFEFRSFTDGVMFVNSLVLFCNHLDHHPDVFVSYKKIRFELTRFSVGGKVTERDFTVARKIEENFEEYANPKAD